MLLALRFFIRLSGKSTPHIEPEAQQWILSDKVVNVQIYYPQHSKGKGCKGTILMVHGMNCLGANDPRVIKLCKVLASVGFLCVTPTIETIAQHLILTSQAEDVREVIRHMIADEAICPDGKLGIFTVSFSGAISILAAADPAIRDHITALLTIGIYHDGVQTINDMLAPSCTDHFARLVALKNLFRLAKSVDPLIDEALECAIQDEFSYVDNGHVAAYVQTLNTADRQRVQQMLAEIESGRYQAPAKVLKQFDPEAFRHGFDFVHCLPDLPFKVYALHSRDDRIMYAVHTRKLKAWLKQQGLPHRIAITTILDHANIQSGPRQLIDVISGSHFMGSYFEDLQTH